MCLECGCGKVGEITIGGLPGKQVASPLLKGTAEEGAAHAHEREHEHEHEHEHGHLHAGNSHTVAVNQAVLAKNDRLAERNRGYFKAKGLLVLNVVSAPGSGKTTLIQQTAAGLNGRVRTGVIV